jgi:hypothetical protein
MNSVPLTSMTKSTPHYGNGLLMMGGVLTGNIPTIAYYYYGVWIGDTTNNYNHSSTNAERGREQRDRIIRFAAYELSKALGDKKPSFPGLLLVQVPNFRILVPISQAFIHFLIILRYSIDANIRYIAVPHRKQQSTLGDTEMKNKSVNNAGLVGTTTIVAPHSHQPSPTRKIKTAVGNKRKPLKKEDKVKVATGNKGVQKSDKQRLDQLFTEMNDGIAKVDVSSLNMKMDIVKDTAQRIEEEGLLPVERIAGDISACHTLALYLLR